MPGCGKEELIRVAQELGFSVVRMGDTVREEAARRKLGTSDEVIGGFAHREREAHGGAGGGEAWRGRGESRPGGPAPPAPPGARPPPLGAGNGSAPPASWEEFLV